MYANGVKIYQFKIKNSELKPYPLLLGNISKDLTVNSIKKIKTKKLRLNWYLYHFSVDYLTINIKVRDIADIKKYLMMENNVWIY